MCPLGVQPYLFRSQSASQIYHVQLTNQLSLLCQSGLNMVSRCLAVDLKMDGVLSVTLDPGWVQTDMGGPQAKISPAESVLGMFGVLARLTEEDSGKFLSYRGTELPW